jgi:hypothetical protein
MTHIAPEWRKRYLQISQYHLHPTHPKKSAHKSEYIIKTQPCADSESVQAADLICETLRSTTRDS